MIYFDNAATGGFKLSRSMDAAESVIRHLSANPGRSGHRLSLTGAKIVYNARELLAKGFNLSTPNKVIFTANCTQALNTAIFGVVSKGDHVITTVFEHNSVLRPLYTLRERGIIDLTIISPDENGEFLNPVKSCLRENTRLVCMTGASNVTGKVTDFSAVGNMLDGKGVLFLVDGAQAGGHVKIDVKADKINLLALAGHKALGGIMGSGVLLIEGCDVKPLVTGGTGTETFNPFQPKVYPERLESGTLNLPAIASLGEAIPETLERLDVTSSVLLKRTEYIIKKLAELPSVRVYSTPNPCGIVAFNIENFSSEELAFTLSERYDIAVRGGFHCAPLMHGFLKTEEVGAVRISLAPQNTPNEISRFLFAINDIVKDI